MYLLPPFVRFDVQKWQHRCDVAKILLHMLRRIPRRVRQVGVLSREGAARKISPSATLTRLSAAYPPYHSPTTPPPTASTRSSVCRGLPYRSGSKMFTTSSPKYQGCHQTCQDPKQACGTSPGQRDQWNARPVSRPGDVPGFLLQLLMGLM